jgi:hypothetical protein
MKMNSKSKKYIFIPFVLGSILLYFIYATFFNRMNDEPLYSECFAGGKLLTTIEQPQGDSRVAQKGQVGYLTYGPYVDLNPGTYSVTLNYTADFEVSDVVVGAVDRAESAGTIPGTEVPLVPKAKGDNEYSQIFEAKSKLAGFEFRVFTNGKSTMEVKELCIKQTE